MKSKFSFNALKSHFIFPIILFALTGWVILSPSMLSAGCSLYFVGRLIFSQHKTLQVWSLIWGLFAVVFFGWISWKAEMRMVLPVASDAELKVKVLPNAFKVNGNLLQFEGEVLDKSPYFFKKDKVIGYYNLSSEEEKQIWLREKEVVVLQVSGEIGLPDSRRNLHSFDYRDYLQTQCIYRSLSVTEIHRQAIKKPQKIEEVVAKIQRRVILQIQANFPPLLASFSKSMLLGEKDFIFKEHQSLLQSLGILHLFTLAGMHLYVYVRQFRYLFLRLGMSQENLYWLVLGLLFFFCLISGFSVSIVRASGMLLLNQANKRWNFQLSPLDIWSLVLFANLLIQPYLFFTFGGQISYLMTFGLIYIRKFGKKFTSFAKGNLFISFAMMVLSLPFLWHYTHQWHFLSFFLLSLLSPLLFHLLLPIVSVCVVISLLRLTYFIQPLLIFTEFCLEKFVSFLEKLQKHTDFFRIVSGASASWQFVLSLFMIFMIILFLHREKYPKAILLVITLFGCMIFGKYFNGKELIAFIDVGQGDSIFFQSPFHQGNYLIDTGGRLNFQTETWKERQSLSSAEKSVLPFLKGQGVKELDILFITHWDADHCGDLPVIAKAVKIKKIVYSAGCEEKEGFRETMNRLIEKNIVVERAVAGATYGDASTVFYSLYPFKKGDGGNDSSLVLLSETGGMRCLLTGDLEANGEKVLQHKIKEMQVDVLKLGHHGSRSSTTEAFLAFVKPKVAMISCGINNRYQHPHEEILARLMDRQIKIYRTDLQGMIYKERYFWQDGNLTFQVMKTNLKEN